MPAMLAAAALLLSAAAVGAGAQRLKITNGCRSEALWVAHMAQVKSGPDKQNIKLSPGESHVFRTPDGLSGTRYWAKMRCDAHGDRCEIGESGGPGQTCNQTLGCAPPVDTKFEASFGAGGVDWVDVSLVDGWTLPFKFHMSKKCSAGDGDRKVRRTVDCSDLSLDDCPGVEHVGNSSNGPLDLRVRVPGSASVVGCYAPCSKLTYTNWKNAAGKYGPADLEAREYCCPTPPESPRACRAGPVKTTKFVKAVHRKCPGVYGYSYDDGMGLLLCPDDTKYEMTFFCPHGTEGADHEQNATERHPLLARSHGKRHSKENSTTWSSAKDEKEGRHEHGHRHKDQSIQGLLVKFFAEVRQEARLPASEAVSPWAVVAMFGAALLFAGAAALKVRAALGEGRSSRVVSTEAQQEPEGEEHLL